MADLYRGRCAGRWIWIKGIVGAIALFTSVGASAALIELTGETWQIANSTDGTYTWNGSTLVFTSQITDGGNANLQGYFDWVGSGGQSGRELFIGTLFDDLGLQLLGQDLINPISIVLGSYVAQVSGASQIVNGQWSAIVAGLPGQWEAVRTLTGDDPSNSAVPLPATLVLIGIGLLGMRRSRTTGLKDD